MLALGDTMHMGRSTPVRLRLRLRFSVEVSTFARREEGGSAGLLLGRLGRWKMLFGGNGARNRFRWESAFYFLLYLEGLSFGRNSRGGKLGCIVATSALWKGSAVVDLWRLRMRNFQVLLVVFQV